MGLIGTGFLSLLDAVEEVMKTTNIPRNAACTNLKKIQVLMATTGRVGQKLHHPCWSPHPIQSSTLRHSGLSHEQEPLSIDNIRLMDRSTRFGPEGLRRCVIGSNVPTFRSALDAQPVQSLMSCHLSCHGNVRFRIRHGFATES